jgi:hypothetical protein
LRRALSLLLLLFPVSLLLLSCGSSSSSGTGPGPTFRALVSQDINAGNIIAGLQIIDAQKDALALVPAISAGATPGMMVETPNLTLTLAFSPAGNTLALVSNAAGSSSATVTLPGLTESIVVSPDSVTAYAAVPTASPGLGQPQGEVEVISLSSGTVTAQLAVPAVRYLSISNSGNRILAFSNSVDLNVGACANQLTCLFVITPSNIGTQTNPVVPVAGFDHPVAAFFSADDNTAFVINCGAECGGTQASVQTIDLTANTLLGAAVDVPAATVALVSGTTMYLAGSYANPSDTDPCPGQTVFSTTCGSLSVLDLPSMSVTNSGIAIANGYHNRIALGADGQLFVGAHTCTETAGVSGCLSIFNTKTAAVVIPPANGDVTGIQPIANRHVVYLIQGGELQIYDTTTDKLQATQINIIGEAVDVKTIDF